MTLRMEFRDYFRSLSDKEQVKYAKKAGTTANYIRCHLIAQPPRKIPRQKLMESLVTASQGRLSISDLLRHFYPEAA